MGAMVEQVGSEKDDYFTAKDYKAINSHSLKSVMEELTNELQAKLDRIGNGENGLVGCSWKIKRYYKIIVDSTTVRPSRGGSHLPTPESFSNPKCGLDSVKSDDTCCFRWCMRYHQSSKSKSIQTLHILKNVEDKYDYADISYPTTYNDIDKFEIRNEICMYVYGVDGENKIRRINA